VQIVSGLRNRKNRHQGQKGEPGKDKESHGNWKEKGFTKWHQGDKTQQGGDVQNKKTEERGKRSLGSITNLWNRGEKQADKRGSIQETRPLSGGDEIPYGTTRRDEPIPRNTTSIREREKRRW